MKTSSAYRIVGCLSLCGTGMGCVGLGGMGMSQTNAVNEAACPQLGGGAENAEFVEDPRANTTIRAFVTASGDLAEVAARAEREVGKACQRMATDLGVEVKPSERENPVTALCGAVSKRIDVILSQGASAGIKAKYEPPRCEVRGDAQAECAGECKVRVDPGYVKAHCEPGHLYGRCEGTCSGECSGTCSGECRGECEGQATASPGAASGDGKCDGKCNGTCSGSCSADCHGGCSVDYKEPKCDVALREPSADGRCNASCKAHATLTADCTEAKVDIRTNVDEGDMGKLAATLRENLPALIRAEIAYGDRLSGDVETLVRTGAELPNAFGKLTGHAAACLGAAANACVSAQASLRVSVRASASISAKARASS